MQDIFKALIIALVQGITEWLPVSSSGHIALAERLLNYPQSLEFEVALHFGTLMAVFAYFGKDITTIIKEALRLNFKSENGKLAIYLLIATIPAALVGFFLEKISYSIFSNLAITSLGFAITGILLIITSISKKQNGKLNNKKSLIIGLAQIFALFPGVSRSGATISTGILSGLNEKNAAKFSFLMSIPIIFGANILIIGNKTIPPELVWATLLSFASGLITLHVFYKYVLTSRKNLRYFGYYAILIAIISLIFTLI